MAKTVKLNVQLPAKTRAEIRFLADKHSSSNQAVTRVLIDHGLSVVANLSEYELSKLFPRDKRLASK